MPKGIRRMKILYWIVLWIILTLTMLPFDQSIHSWVWTSPKGLLRDVLTANDYLSGYPIHLFIISILFAQSNWKKLLSGYLAVMIGQGLVVDLIKILVGRGRPLMEKGAFYFHPFSPPRMEMTSFPSGDATAALALATLLGIYYPKSKWLFWLLALGSGLSRIARGRHFPSDVIFGAGLGVACAVFATHLLGASYYSFGLNQTDALNQSLEVGNWKPTPAPEVVSWKIS